MSRRKPRSGLNEFATVALRLVTLALVAVILILILASTVAQSIVAPTHPLLRAAIAWFVLCCAAAFVAFLTWKWQTRRRTRYRELMQLLALTPSQFEQAVADLLTDLGYRRVRRIGKAGDLAADITAFDRDGLAVVVQCKRLAPGSKIGSPDVQKFIGMVAVHHRAERGIFVTTSAFTEPAIALGKQHSLTLIDGEYLSRLVAAVHHDRRDAKELAHA